MQDLTVITQPGSEATVQAIHLLQQAGFQVSCSFDLRATRAFQGGCSCPHHDTVLCDCQYAILLVQLPGESPLTLLVHSRDGFTWLSLVDDQALDTNPQTAVQVAQLVQRIEQSRD
jgi:hypothetical protein